MKPNFVILFFIVIFINFTLPSFGSLGWATPLIPRTGAKVVQRTCESQESVPGSLFLCNGEGD